MSSRIQLRRSLSAEWTAVNPRLSQGEIGYEIDTGKFKIGDGVRSWNSDLPYIEPKPLNISSFVNDEGYIRQENVPTKVSDLDNDSNFLVSSVFTTSPASAITSQQVTNWNSAYNWGDHSVEGYLLSSIAATTYQLKNVNLDALITLSNSPTSQGILRKVLNTSGGYDWILDPSDYLTSADLGNISSANISNWNTAYSWGNHATAGYITGVTSDNRYQTKDDDLTAIAGISSTTGLLRKIAANSWSLDANTYLTTTAAASTYQSKNDSLTNISGLTGTSGLLRKTGENLWALDTSTYLSSATAASTYLTITTASSTYLTASSASTTYLSQTNASNTYLSQSTASTTYQPLDSDLTTIAGLTTNGVLRRTAGTWGVDTSEYAAVVGAPATATSTGTAGQIAYDNSFIYICIATNTWERAAIASW